MKPIFIYTLNDPVTGVVRYCGQTENPDKRLREHLRTANKLRRHCACWIRKLLAQNLWPIMEIVDVIPDSEADFWEVTYIQNFRERGFDLTNLTSGGKGLRNPSDEVRYKLRTAQLGKKHSPETIEKLRAAGTGRKHSIEARAKMSAAGKGKRISVAQRAAIGAASKGNKYWVGKKHSPETIEKIRAAKKGKKHSPETIEKMSASRKGKKHPWQKGKKRGPYKKKASS